MLWHYLITAFHNLRRHKLATLMHLLGLSLGLACFVLSFTFIDSLKQGEPNLPDADRTYVLTQTLRIRNAARELPASPFVTLAAYAPLKADFPQLASVTRAAAFGGPSGANRITLSSGERNGFVYPLFVDPDFLKIFHLKVVAGDPGDPFKGRSGAIITTSAARRIFGTTEVVGRRVMFGGNIQGAITAVIEDVPQPSHLGDSERALLRFDLLSPLDESLFGPVASDWTSPLTFIYATLPADGSLSVEALRASLRTFGERHMDASTGSSRFEVVPVSAVRQLLVERGFVDTGISLSASLYTLDALVLLIACFNYANLTSALAMRRTREIALRKIVGARRRQLVLQCMVEAAVVATVALGLAVATTLAAIPLLDSLLTQTLRPAAFAQPRMWLFLAGLTFAAVGLAGIYPALALSRLQPVEALRASASRRGRFVPQALIGLQFAAAGFLIVMVLIVQGQNHLMRSALAGIARNPIIAVTTGARGGTLNMSTLRTRLLESPAIQSVSSTNMLPWSVCCWVFIVSHSPDAAAKAVQAAGNQVGVDFFKTMGLELLAGRTFREHSEDEINMAEGFSTRPYNVVIDRALAAQLGWEQPAAAIGATIYRPTYAPVLTLRIIGVVENASTQITGQSGSTSNIYLFTPSATLYPLIRFNPGRTGEAVAHLTRTWKSLVPALPLERRFLDELFEQAYVMFGIISQVATGLTVCAFVIALMGLSGMAVQVTNGRLREIGVRKTLGAKSRHILVLLLMDFAKPVVIANLIAWPFAYLAARAYLAMFLTPLPLSPLYFLASLLATVTIACLVVSGQAVRAARSQPAQVLRSE